MTKSKKEKKSDNYINFYYPTIFCSQLLSNFHRFDYLNENFNILYFFGKSEIRSIGAIGAIGASV